MQNENIHSLFMSPVQLQTELLRCEFCEEKPCREACPVNCSPADFIMAARVGNPSDLRRSAAEIMHANPLGGICGMVCPDTLCMAACTHKKFDGPINIPLVQATIIEMAKNQGGIPEFSHTQAERKESGHCWRWPGRIGRGCRPWSNGLPGGHFREPQPAGWDGKFDP